MGILMMLLLLLKESGLVNSNLGHDPVLEALLTRGISNMLGDYVANVEEDTITIDLVLLQKVDCQLMHLLDQSAIPQQISVRLSIHYDE